MIPKTPDSSPQSSASNPLLQLLCDALWLKAITEYQFQREADMLRALRRAFPDLWVQLRADGTVLNVNSSSLVNLFPPSDEFIHRDISEFLPPEPLQALKSAMDSALRDQRLATCVWQLQQSEEKYFEVRVSYLNPDQVLVGIRDITAQYQLVEQLRDFPRRLLRAQEDERRRLASDLHDELGQDLTAIQLQLYRIQMGTTGRYQTNLTTMEDALLALTHKVRRLAQELHPATLDDLGLSVALESLCRSVARQTDLNVQLSVVEKITRFSSEIEYAVYRIVQEALTNVVRHARAKHVTVGLRQDDQCLVIEVADDGQGFDAARAEIQDTYGLRSLRERAALLGAHFELSTAPGQGTRLTINLPIVALKS